MISQTLKKQICESHGIPDNIPVEWGVIEEHSSLVGDQLRPALLVGGNHLALDILQFQFRTEIAVLGAYFKIYEANEVVENDDDDELLIKSDIGNCELDLQSVYEIRLRHWFSDDLLERANANECLL